MAKVLIMAGGTGGHVYPALAVARALQKEQIEVVWLGTRAGLEARAVPAAGIDIQWISIRSLRGQGALGYLALPFMLGYAMIQSVLIMRRIRPDAVLSMGGFVAGPGGLVAWLMRIPLVVHEQNAVPGLTNRVLSYFAARVLTGFPGVFGNRPKVTHVGNPVREEIAALPAPGERLKSHSGPLRVLVLGGSQGARTLNTKVALAYLQLIDEERPALWHQCGERWFAEVCESYGKHGRQVRITPFIEDMAEAYDWADIVLCRAGAMTLAELAAVGLGAILVPLPSAADDHQMANARYMVKRGAAELLTERDCAPERLRTLWQDLAENREVALKMANAAHESHMPGAAQQVVAVLKELSDA